MVLDAAGAPGELRYRISNNEGYDWADPYARAYRFEDGQEVSLAQASAGHLERWLEVGGQGIAPRTLRVWVPERHPTHFLYVHDGQNLFHPEAIWGGWNLHHHVGPSTLVVGIDNSPDRMNEYTHVEDHVFGDKVGGEALTTRATSRIPFDPLSSPLRDATGGWGHGLFAWWSDGILPGSSLSGELRLCGVAFWDVWLGLVRPAYSDDDRYLPFDVKKVETRLYLDSGGGTGDPCADLDGDGIKDDSPGGRDNYCANRQFADELAAAGYEWDKDLWHWYEPDAPHAEWAWSERVWRPLEIFEDITP